MSLFDLFKKAPKRVATGVVTAALLPAVAFLGLSTMQGSHMTAEFEGLVLKNYKDVVGVETWCYGETQMGRLEQGYTKEYCEALFRARYGQYSARLYQCYDDTMKGYVTPNMHAAFTDVYYNTGKKCDTGMMRNLKNADPVAACDYIFKYKFAGGKDCSQRDSGCYGVWERRVKFHNICIQDAKLIKKTEVKDVRD